MLLENRAGDYSSVQSAYLACNLDLDSQHQDDGGGGGSYDDVNDDGGGASDDDGDNDGGDDDNGGGGGHHHDNDRPEQLLSQRGYIEDKGL